MGYDAGYAGIDYGHGLSNMDRDTGIRYGVINQNAEHLGEWLHESIESIYLPGCPHCGHHLDKDFDAPDDCPRCGSEVGEDEQWADEPVGWELIADGYLGELDSQGDLFITKSPYYTHAQYCSPCAPGAGHLENPCPSGPKTYCLGHEWFEDGTPYPVYSVETGKIVED